MEGSQFPATDVLHEWRYFPLQETEELLSCVDVTQLQAPGCLRPCLGCSGRPWLWQDTTHHQQHRPTRSAGHCKKQPAPFLYSQMEFMQCSPSDCCSLAQGGNESISFTPLLIQTHTIHKSCYFRIVSCNRHNLN